VHVEPSTLAQMPVRAIQPQHVRSWVESVATRSVAPGNGHRARRRPLARQTIANVLNLLRSCLGAAVDRGIIASNPAAGVHVPKRKSDLTSATQEPWTWLDEQEQATVIAQAPKPLGWLVQFATWTGLREAELWELRAADVHTGARAHVVVRYGSAGGPTKTRRIRRVPLLPGALEAWEAWRADELVARRIAETGVAFPPLRGSTRKTRACGPPPWWERAVAGVRGQTGARVTFHSLRHTCASMLVSGSWGPAWSLEEVRAMLGHQSIATTERYAHLAEGALYRAAARTAAAITIR
jgi:integrase/recombinase XerC